MCGPYSATTIQNGFILMLILTILLSLALAAAFTLLPAGIHHRRPARADLYAGAGGVGTGLAVGGLRLVQARAVRRL